MPLARSSGIVVRGREDTLAVIVASFEDGARPFSQEALGCPFDRELGLFGFGVEKDDFTDAAGYQTFLVDGQSCQAGEQFALDVIGR